MVVSIDSVKKPELVKRFSITIQPTLLLLDNDAKEIKRFFARITSQEFLNAVNPVQIRIQAPPVMYQGRRARIKIFVKNTSQQVLKDVTIKPISPLAKIYKPQPEIKQGTWEISRLEPGLEVMYKLQLISKKIGKYDFRVAVSGEQITPQYAQHWIQWKGIAALMIEAIDTEDPILVGEETLLKIKVAN